MDQILLDIGLKEGIFAILFIWLLFHVINASKAREDKLYNFLDGMKEEFAKLVGSYESLSNDVADIRSDIDNQQRERERLKDEDNNSKETR